MNSVIQSNTTQRQVFLNSSSPAKRQESKSMTRHMAGFLQSLHHKAHTFCALFNISLVYSLCSIFPVKSSGNLVHGGDGGDRGGAEHEEASLDFFLLLSIFDFLNSVLMDMLVYIFIARFREQSVQLPTTLPIPLLNYNKKI